MHQSISTYHNTPYSDPDESIYISVLLGDVGDSVKFHIEKTTSEVDKYGSSDPKEVSEEKLELNDINYDDFEDLVKRVKTFLESESKPTFSASLTEIDGVYIEDKAVDSFPGPPRSETSTYDFDSVDFSIGEFWFYFRSSEEETNWGLELPAPDRISNNNAENYNNIITLHKTFVDFLNSEYSREVNWLDQKKSSEMEETSVDKIEFLFERFKEIATPLQNRSRGRDPVSMEDEYDVQYLLHGLLKLYFDDVRDEEYLRQHTAISPRIDFLLENQGIGIEVKRPSEGKSLSTLRKELAEDKECYRGDSRCELLLIFIYDPDRTIINAPEFKRSLSEEDTNLVTRATIVQ